METDKKKVYIETYGCQMNVADSEVVAAILQNKRYEITQIPSEANLILINTCSIRDNAEQRVRGRLENFRQYKKKKDAPMIGVIGCMAERLKDQLLEQEKIVDLVVGPDAYRNLPQLIDTVEVGQKAVDTILSLEETYADIEPVRLGDNKVSAFISIMRGCDNLCSYCVVPYTRGRERSRDPQTILREAGEVFSAGYGEITLLGQNVNSFNWTENGNEDIGFPGLLALVAKAYPSMRLRFSTSHPKDLSIELLNTIAMYPNICRSIHLPVQSGSSSVLKKMKRRYTREEYLDKIEAIRRILPEASISSDIITGFCGETEEDHKQTLSLMSEAAYDFAYMFKYSERPGTFAAKNYPDDVPEETKTRRLNEIIALQGKLSLKSKKKDVGEIFEVLAEGTSKKSDKEMYGRTSQNKVVIFPTNNHKPGDYVFVKIKECTQATLKGEEVVSTTVVSTTLNHRLR